VSLERLKEGLRRRAEEKAVKIIQEAEERARKILEEAKREYEERLRKTREDAINRLRSELSKKLVEESMKLGIELVNLKNRMLNEILNEVKSRISKLPEDVREKSLTNLFNEALESGVFGKAIRIKVVSRDKQLMKKILNSRKISKEIIEIQTLDDHYIGGVIIESEDGNISIDNTYLTRLERVAQLLIKKLNEEIFKG
jgi:V/A-type H+-transporting ATPase subunit E